MVSTTHLEPVVNTFLFLTNILSTAKIDELVVHGVVASDCLDAVLECEYSGTGDDATVLWLHDGSQVYEWRRGAEPDVTGLLHGRLELTYRITNILSTAKIDELVVHGVVASDCLDAVLECEYSGTGDDATVLWLHDGSQVYEWRRGAEPDVTGFPWRERLLRGRGTSAAVLPRAALRPRAVLACRLHLPHLDYAAITNKHSIQWWKHPTLAIILDLWLIYLLTNFTIRTLKIPIN